MSAISKEEVIALGSSTQVYYQQVMDSGDEILTFVLPFNLFPYKLGSGAADNQSYYGSSWYQNKCESLLSSMLIVLMIIHQSAL